MVFRPRDLADRMAARRRPDDGFLRETFTLPRAEARTTAEGLLHPLSQGRLYERGRKLARTARRRHRVHHAQAAQRRLAGRRHHAAPVPFFESLTSDCTAAARSCVGQLALCGRSWRSSDSGLAFFCAQQFAARAINEMEPAAGLADHGFVTGVRIIGGLVRQPVLYVHASLRTFEDDVGHRPTNLRPAR